MIELNYYQQTLAQQQSGPAPYAEFYLYEGDIQGFGIDWNGWLAYHWMPGQVVAISYVQRPTVPNGFEYICTLAGQTAGSEPDWAAAIGAVIIDGGAEWTCQALSTASLSTTVSSAVWSAQSPLTTASPNVGSNLTSIVANTTNCIPGTDYMLVCLASMVNGTTKTGKFKIKVR